MRCPGCGHRIFDLRRPAGFRSDEFGLTRSDDFADGNANSKANTYALADARKN